MSNDLWETPKPVYNTLDREFEFVADMAASDENALCDLYFTEEDDSLSFDWFDMIKSKNADFYNGYNAYVWLNCPYSDPIPWVKKAVEAQLKGLGVVMLLNADTSVGWFFEAYATVSEIRHVIGYIKENGKFTPGRIAFVNNITKKPIKSNNKPQFFLIFNPYDIAGRRTRYIEAIELYKQG